MVGGLVKSVGQRRLVNGNINILEGVPVRSHSCLGPHFQDQEFQLCLQYWLGLPMSAGENITLFARLLLTLYT